MGNKTQLRREPVREPTPVYRVVRTGDINDRDALAQELRSEREKGAVAESRREKAVPEVLDAVCVDKTLEAARRRWQLMYIAAQRDGVSEPREGMLIAEIVLQGEGFLVEDRNDRQGKVLIWGDPAKLAKAVCRIIPAVREQEGDG